MLPLSECPRHSFTILAQLLFITALHELLDVCQQFLLRLWQTALDMEQIGGVFVHEDSVVAQAAHQLVNIRLGVPKYQGISLMSASICSMGDFLNFLSLK